MAIGFLNYLLLRSPLVVGGDDGFGGFESLVFLLSVISWRSVLRTHSGVYMWDTICSIGLTHQSVLVAFFAVSHFGLGTFAGVGGLFYVVGDRHF